MIITACLAWYAEPLAFLNRCVRSLAPFCDRLVGLEGPWDLFPADTKPHPEEIDAVGRAAAEMGLEVTIGQGWYGSQVSKRDSLMRLAAAGSDWLLVIDGDEHLEVLDAASARAALEETSFDVAQVLLDPMNEGWPLREMPANKVPVRRLYRAGVRCPGPSHAIHELDGLYLAGDPDRIRLEPALDLSSVIVLHHDNQNRGQQRDDAAKEYRRARGRARVEAWT